jgi:hypothetical protein
MFIGAGHDQQIKLEAFQGLPIEADLKPSHPLAVVQSAKLHQSIAGLRLHAMPGAWTVVDEPDVEGILIG